MFNSIQVAVNIDIESPEPDCSTEEIKMKAQELRFLFSLNESLCSFLFSHYLQFHT